MTTEQGEPVNATDSELAGLDYDALFHAHKTLPPYDTHLLGDNAEQVSAESVRARLAAETQDAVDAKMREWFGTELEQDGI